MALDFGVQSPTTFLGWLSLLPLLTLHGQSRLTTPCSINLYFQIDMLFSTLFLLSDWIDGLISGDFNLLHLQEYFITSEFVNLAFPITDLPTYPRWNLRSG